MVGYAAERAVVAALFPATMAGVEGHWAVLTCAVAVGTACVPLAYVGVLRASLPPWVPFAKDKGRLRT